MRTGVAERGEQRLRGEVAVGQHDHPAVHPPEQVEGVGGLPEAAGTECHVDRGAGAARHQGEKAHPRILGAAVKPAAAMEDLQIRRGVRAAHHGAVDGRDQ